MKHTLLILLLASFAKLFAQTPKTDKSIKLEKIVFHSGACFGSCPVISAEVDCKRKVKYKASAIFKAGSRTERDSSQMGSYKGSMSKSEYKALEKMVKTLDPDNLNVKEVTCCDAPVITIIMYYNKGKRKVVHSMILPEELSPLANYMHNITQHAKLKKTKETLTFEEIKTE